MAQKLAIAISGAVSLGSYEAGVMYEVIEAIRQHNEDCKSNHHRKIKIDVITGASAGAMTACILAQKLLFDANALSKPDSNALYQAWVEDVDITKLLTIRGDDNPFHSVLSSQLIKKIGYHHLLDRYKDEKRSINTHNAAADQILLGIAMSNLTGFDFEENVTDYRQLKNSQQSTFVYTKHQDRYTAKLEASSKCDTEQTWQRIEEMGRASGAFPFAFRVLGINRSPTEEAYQGAKTFNLPEFCYTDGGVFENEPLGLAKSLVNRIDTGPRDYEKRFYLYVAPGIKQSSSNRNFSPRNANYWNTTKALGSAIFTQARFRDWIETNRINKDIRQFDRQSEMLKSVVLQQNSQTFGDCLNTVAGELLNALYATDEDPIPNPETGSSETYTTDLPAIDSRRGKVRDEDEARLKAQFEEEYNEIAQAHGNKLALSWLRAVQVLEKAAALGNRDVMKIYAITSEDENLIGEGLSAFVGFLDQRFRKFDYDVGRRAALESLSALQNLHAFGQGQQEIDLTKLPLNTPPQLNPKLVNVAKQNKFLSLLNLSFGSYFFTILSLILWLFVFCSWLILSPIRGCVALSQSLSKSTAQKP